MMKMMKEKTTKENWNQKRKYKRKKRKGRLCHLYIHTAHKFAIP